LSPYVSQSITLKLTIGDDTLQKPKIIKICRLTLVVPDITDTFASTTSDVKICDYSQPRVAEKG